MSQTSGTKQVSHESDLVSHISGHFNNPDMSDLTLTVGEQSYYVHRFVLASQSSVFHTMLMNHQWTESTDKIVKLEESAECQEAFGSFLQFLYTAKLTLTCENVCGIHMLADKYDVQLLKQDAVKFMEDVLSGHHDGKVLFNAVNWLNYIEQFIPNLVDTCYRAVRINFNGFAYGTNPVDIGVLSTEQLSTILRDTEQNAFAAYSEQWIFNCVSKWANSKFTDLSGTIAKADLNAILPLIHFHNMKYEELQVIEDSDLFKALGKSFVNSYVTPAYKVHAQMLTILQHRQVGERTSQHRDQQSIRKPRLYMKEPFGTLFKIHNTYVYVNPVDLGNVGAYAKMFCRIGPTDEGLRWEIRIRGHYRTFADSDYYETFVITPDASHVGRKYTIAISISTPQSHYRYTVIDTGLLTSAGQFELQSQKRKPRSWKIDCMNASYLGVAVHLHA